MPLRSLSKLEGEGKIEAGFLNLLNFLGSLTLHPAGPIAADASTDTFALLLSLVLSLYNADLSSFFFYSL